MNQTSAPSAAPLAQPSSTTHLSPLEQWVGVLAVPVLMGLVGLRQAEKTLIQWGEWSETLIQGDRLPILDRWCSSAQNPTEQEAVRY